MASIPIHPEHITGNVSPLLVEIKHALQKLLEQNEPTCIDLNSLPFSPDDEQALRERLGQGEIKAELNSLGVSHIWETQISGVWWVEHFNVENQKTNQYLEITWIPDILKSQQEDVRASLEQM
ncbi:hydrogenase expression/formation C-terminal domain-containing protein [Candidatus Albibeggiatoa sp. nov. NOAA]|uniref:hydrogenase expression/formation C-terminal domain-containing protein n=1 Tax=Candidatus Albibeggiatoa sp. nov. NOAA TaxID=3162724 RepID=UPI0032FFA9FA|nr:hydrogenase expression/formation protein [Thiotrichaceae bacterium]